MIARDLSPAPTWRAPAHLLPIAPLAPGIIDEWVSIAEARAHLTYARVSRLPRTCPGRDRVQELERAGMVNAKQARVIGGMFDYMIERTSRPFVTMISAPNVRPVLSPDALALLSLIEGVAAVGGRFPKVAYIAAHLRKSAGAVAPIIAELETSGALIISRWWGPYARQWIVARVADTAAQTAPPPKGEPWRIDVRSGVRA